MDRVLIMKALVLDATWEPKEDYELSTSEREQRRAERASAVWRDPELRVEERERPTPDADELVVAVRYVGVCGSDVAMFETDADGYVHYPAYASLPNVLGHEFVGEVVETGPDARIFEPGDLVTAEVTEYCGRCRMCRRGFHGHCENFEQLGFTIPGTAAEYAAVSEKLCWGVSSMQEAYADEEDVLRAAATVEPSTITYYGLYSRAEGIMPGDYYAFHGAGPIGLTGMNVARAAGAGRVIVLEPSKPRRRIAEKMGFEHVYDPTVGDPREVLDVATDGEGVDVHAEVSGAVEQTYPVIQDTLAEGANIVHVSNAPTTPALQTRALQGNTAQVYGSEGHTGQQIYPRVIRLMAAGKLDNLPIVTSTYSLEDGPAAIKRAAERVDGKVLIEI